MTKPISVIKSRFRVGVDHFEFKICDFVVCTPGPRY